VRKQSSKKAERSLLEIPRRLIKVDDTESIKSTEPMMNLDLSKI